MFGSSSTSAWAQRWNSLAQELGLSARSSRKQSSMRGEIGGCPVSVMCGRNGVSPKVKVRFDSGLRHIGIRRRGQVVAADGDLMTGDPAFDAAFRIRVGIGDPEIAWHWLNPGRRAVITGLSSAVELTEVEENKVKARLSDLHWTDDELKSMVRLCVAAAQQLDSAAAEDVHGAAS